MNKYSRTISLIVFLLFCKAFVMASGNNGITDITVDQGFLTAGKGNADHILLRINLKRDLLREAPLLSGLRISLDGTTDFNDISSLKVYATQTPFLNGDIKAYSLLLAEAGASAENSLDIPFSSDFMPLKEVFRLRQKPETRLMSGVKVCCARMARSCL